LAKSSQNSLIFNEEDAISFLQERGYRVVKVDDYDGRSITSIPQLVQFFYARRRYYNPERKYPESMDNTNDRIFIGGFVQSRKKLGLDKKTAIKECTQIIEAMFKYENLLKLETPILSPRILGVRPIMDRVCSFLNGEVAEVGEIDAEMVVKQYNDYYNRHFAEEDLQYADLRRKDILEKLNEQK
jgi:hypothetical protein